MVTEFFIPDAYDKTAEENNFESESFDNSEN